MIVDGARFDPPTHCRCGALAVDAKYNGAQETITPGDWLLLATCRSCHTTFVHAALNEATRCAGCAHVIVGDCEDPKIVVGLRDGTHRIVCAGCAPRMPGLHEAFPETASAQWNLDAMAARLRYRDERCKAEPASVPRTEFLTLGECRAQGG